jgi:hypothetical protein
MAGNDLDSLVQLRQALAQLQAIIRNPTTRGGCRKRAAREMTTLALAAVDTALVLLRERQAPPMDDPL